MFFPILMPAIVFPQKAVLLIWVTGISLMASGITIHESVTSPFSPVIIIFPFAFSYVKKISKVLPPFLALMTKRSSKHLTYSELLYVYLCVHYITPAELCQLTSAQLCQLLYECELSIWTTIKCTTFYIFYFV